MRKIILITFLFFSFSIFSSVFKQFIPVLEKSNFNHVSLDKLWKQNFPTFENFYQIDPGNNISPSRKTIFKVFATKDSIVFLFKCYFKKGDKIYFKNQRDDVYDTDEVRIVFDPFAKAKMFYYIVLTPQNNVEDGLFDPLSKAFDNSFDFVFYHKTLIKNGFWFGYVEIPFSSIHFPEKKKQKWLISVERIMPLKTFQEIDSIVKVNRDSNDVRDGKMYIEFNLNTKKRKQKSFKLIPSFVYSHLKHEEEFFGQSNNYSSDKGDFGLTVEYSPSSNTMLKATIHPDFSQVEADDAYQRVNNRYPVYLREKRPFFMDGMESFSTPFELLYTRKIVKPEYGVKFSSKFKNKYGLYLISAMEKDVPGERFGLSGDVKHDTYWNVLRTTYNLDNKGSFLGFMAVQRNYGSDFNRVVGIDGVYLKGKFTFLFQGVLSKLDQAENSLSGNGLYCSLNYKMNRYFQFGTQYQSLSPDFVNDAGFFYRTDYRTYQVFSRFSYLPEKNTGWIKSISATLSYQNTYNYQSVLINQKPFASFSIFLKHKIFVKLTYDSDNEEYLGKIYPVHKSNIQISWMKYPSFAPGVLVGHGSSILYGSNPQLVNNFYLVFFINNTFNRLSLSSMLMYYSYDEKTTGSILRKQSILQVKARYNFNEKMNFKIFYQTFLADMKDINFNYPYHYINLLFTWRKNAFTKLYIGYNNGHSSYRTSDETLWGFDRDKYFYVKMTYLF